MKIIFPSIALIAITLTSFGGLHYYQNPTASQSEENNTPQLKPVILKTGDTLKLLKHTRGIAVGGGYIEGIVVENPAIARIHYGKGSESNKFAPQASVTGVQRGTTRAVYCNRLGERPDFSQPLPADFQRKSFVIEVR